MICPVRGFSGNTSFYLKLAADVQYEATVLKIALSDRIYMCEQLVKMSVIYHWSFFWNNIRKPAKYPKITFQENDEKLKHYVNHVKYHGKLSFKCITIYVTI